MIKAAAVMVAAGLLLTGCVTVNVVPKPTETSTPLPTVAESLNCVGITSGKNFTANMPGVTYTLTGTCGAVSIQGQDITVSIDGAKSVTINGDRNTVTAKSLGAVSIQGQDNTMSATVIGALTINGDRNTVTAPAVGPKSVNGQSNSVGG